jgi:hypothetical protein
MKHLEMTQPATLVVAPNQASQRSATAALVRPGEVAGVAAALTPWVGPGAAEADVTASWLHGLRFVSDPPTRDVWQAPRTTIRRGGGDCEDLGLAALSLLLALSCYGVLVVGIMFTHLGPIGHAWVEGWDSAGWFHLEPTTAVMSRFGRPPVYIPYAMYTPSPSA